MTSVPFDINYRPQIESGRYQLITDEQESASILKWNAIGDYPIVAIINNNYCDNFNLQGESRFFNKKLFIVGETILTPFEQALSDILYQESENDFLTPETREYYDNLAHKYSKELLKLI